MRQIPQHHEGWIGKLLTGLYGLQGLFKAKNVRLSPQALDEQIFGQETREQLVELKRKGLSIPIFTL